MNNSHKINAIDALLPQTQCGLCTYKGCKPYATAIIEDNEKIDLCLPGGTRTLHQLGTLLAIDTAHMQETMQQKAKPPMLANIREAECIGCTKCIQACPVDAIIGAAKLMHTVITDACNGCELCIEPCPVDCIDMIELPPPTEEQVIALQQQSRERFEKHNQRIARDAAQKREKHLKAKQAGSQKQTIDARRAAIAAALARKKGQTDSL